MQIETRPASLPRESGMSNLLVLLGLMLIMAGGSLFIGNFKASRRAEDNINQAISSENGDRFVLQMVSDDELCTVTDFMKDLKGYQLTGTNAGYIELKRAGFVDYSKIGVTNLKWPTNGFQDAPDVSGHLFGSRGVIRGKATSVGLYYEQPPTNKRPVVVTTLPGKTITRVPVDVWQYGTINGASAFFNSLETYIEFDSTAADPNTPVACYRAVSSRSLCLDRSGNFDPKATMKCKL